MQLLRWRGPPLSLQILGLLLGGLVVAQLVTLLLTVMLPPGPKRQYGLDDIAGVLRGTSTADRLERHLQPGPPDVSGGGWLVSERSRRELATLLDASETVVSLAFYTPLPFAGTAIARPMAAMANDGPMLPDDPAALRPAAYLLFQPAAVPAAGVPASGARSGFLQPPVSAAIPRDGFPPGTLRGGLPVTGPRAGRAFEFGRAPGTTRGGGRLYAIDPTPIRPGERGVLIPGDNGAAVPAILGGTTTTVQKPSATPTTTPAPLGEDLFGLRGAPEARFEGRFESGRLGGGSLLRQILPDRSLLRLPPPIAPRGSPLREADVAPIDLTPSPRVAPAPPPRIVVPPPAAVQIPFALPVPAPAPTPTPERAPPPLLTQAPYGPPIPIMPTTRGLFGLAPAPFVEGDFVAALRLPGGDWAVVQPAREPFPNAWQRRVLLWFAVAFAIVAPIGWLFARRLVTPLHRFAIAAEVLGRDPSAAILPLDGPAEIGRAANAFNLMQSRLRSFVDDRTAMIGAISHDLRTPLTRMRFRIEDTDGEVRDGLLEEVDAMEAMITQVIAFIRDASVPGVRERLDLGTIVEDVIEDAQMIGTDVTLEGAELAPVEVDVLGIRRVLDNLLENAIKYGTRARIRLTSDEHSVVAQIRDDGPGLPDDELERAFEPFYRSEAARASDKAGSGLGLAVCRSIARAHGGDVRLIHSDGGFVAEMRLPRAFGAERSLAA